MPKLMIELPETFGFTRAKQIFTVDAKRLSSEIAAQLVMHGATQKIGDAAAGKDGDEAMTAMNAVAEALYEGDWGRARGNSAEPAINRFIRAVVRGALSEASKAEYKALEADGRDDWLWAKFEAAPEKVQKAITEKAEAAMEQAKREREEARKMAQSLAL